MNATITAPKLAAKAKRTRLFFKAISYNGSTLVFAPPAMAEGHHKLMKALENSKTWGEFRAAIAASDFKEIKQLFSERDECSAKEIRELTSDDQPFRADAIPGVEDAEYPSMIGGIQASILPVSIVEKYGKQWGAFNCSNICRIDVRDRDAILADLAALGYEVIERSDLEFF
jgi:hypothetical protein